MAHPWHDLSAGASPPEEISVVVEIPKGSRNKYELDKVTGLFRLDRVLHSAVHYPGDYGFIPRTLSLDGDPCDVLVLVLEPSFPGCRIDVRPIGVLRMLDRGEPDEKIVAVPIADPLQRGMFDIADVPAHLLRVIEHFFQIYKELEGGHVDIIGWEQSVEAFKSVSASIERYAEEHRLAAE